MLTYKPNISELNYLSKTWWDTLYAEGKWFWEDFFVYYCPPKIREKKSNSWFDVPWAQSTF